jgi:hypothetical protein
MYGQRSKLAVLKQIFVCKLPQFFYRLNMETNLIMFNTERREKFV